ncbi:MAG: hypothetical protein CSB55_00515 [Candidatus Cloacimonadota bacterium]|nr:MAG: hypothetical protein CSB55_00515 [Candidatus Cloacimonadota bacterium]
MKLRLKHKTGYGVLSIADQCLYFMFGTFFLFFLTVVAGINPVIAGIIASFGAIWDAVSALWVGHLSDNCTSEKGKRKPFIFYSAIPATIITVLIFTKVDFTPALKILYYLIVTLLFWTAFSMFFIPVLAWGAELTGDYDERTVLRGFAYAGNTLGMAVGSVLPAIFVDYFRQKGNSVAVSWQLSACVVGAAVVGALWGGLFLLKDKKEKTESAKNIGETKYENYIKSDKNIFSKIKKMLCSAGEIIKIPSLTFLLAGSILYLGANTVFLADRMYYYTFNMGLTPKEISRLMLLEPFAGIIFLPLILLSSKVLDRRMQFISGMLICGISMIFLRFTGVNTFGEAGFMLIVFGLGAVCYWQLMPAMVYDVCRLDILKNGKERQGSIVSLQVFSESASEALGLIILGVILNFSGFDGEAGAQSAKALRRISDGFTLIPGILMILSAYSGYKYPITKKIYVEIERELANKRQGKLIDTEKFKHL